MTEPREAPKAKHLAREGGPAGPDVIAPDSKAAGGKMTRRSFVGGALFIAGAVVTFGGAYTFAKETFFSPHGITAEYLTKDVEGAADLLRRTAGAAIYPLFSDEVRHGEVSYFSGNCATRLSITNHEDTAVNLVKVRLVAEEIKPDLKAELILFPAWDHSRESDGIWLTVCNQGWLEASSLSCTLSCDDEEFARYFGGGPFEWGVPDVGIGEMVEFGLLDSGDVVGAPDEKVVFDVVFTVRSSEGELHGEAEERLRISVDADGRVAWVSGGIGDSGKTIYGIPLDTHKTSDIFEASTNLIVEGHGVEVIPVCFFPDRSCSVTCHFEFDGEDGAVAVTTPSEEVYIDILSTAKNAEPLDATKLTSDDLLQVMGMIEKYPETMAITFPYDGYWLSS